MIIQMMKISIWYLGSTWSTECGKFNKTYGTIQPFWKKN